MKVMKRLYAFRNETVSFIRYTLFIGCRRTLKMIFKMPRRREGDVWLVPFVPREVFYAGSLISRTHQNTQ